MSFGGAVPAVEAPAPHGEGELIVPPITPQPIGVVTIYPGISADVVGNFLRQPVKALILRSYGVGNAPQQGAFMSYQIR